MDSSCSRVNPPQFFRGAELLGPKRSGDHDVCGRDVVFDIVVVGTVNKLDIREFAPQTIHKGLRRIPEREVVLRYD